MERGDTVKYSRHLSAYLLEHSISLRISNDFTGLKAMKFTCKLRRGNQVICNLQLCLAGCDLGFQSSDHPAPRSAKKALFTEGNALPKEEPAVQSVKLEVTMPMLIIYVLM